MHLQISAGPELGKTGCDIDCFERWNSDQDFRKSHIHIKSESEQYWFIAH